MVGFLGGITGGATVNIVIRAVDQFSQTFKKAGLGLAGFAKAGVIAGAVGAAIAGGMALAVTKAAKVETGFAKVNTLLEEGQSAQQIYGKFVKETNVLMGNQGDQLDVLSGLYQTISAGVTDTAEAQEFMNRATIAAVGGSAELSQVILAGTKAIAGFGLEVSDTERVMDVFAGAVKAGQTTMGELASAFPTIAGLAGEAGITLEETAGTLAGLTKFLGSTDEASTALGQTIISLLKPMPDMEEAIKAAGYESGILMLKDLGLNKTVKTLTDSVGGEADAIANLFKNKRALIGVLPMVGKGMDDIVASIDIVTNSAGLSQKQFEDMRNTIEYKWGEVMSNAGNIITDVGNILKEILLPALVIVSKAIAKVAEWWTNLSPIMQKAILIGTAATAMILLLAGAVAILTFIMSPWLLIIFAVAAAIGVLVAAGYLLWKNWDIIKEKLSGVVNFLKKWFAPQIALATIVVKLLGMAFTWIWKNKIKPVWDKLKVFIDWIKTTVLPIFEKVIGKIGSFISKVADARSKFGDAISSAGDNILGSRAVGGPILKTGPYMLHKGETVVTRNRNGGGGTTIIIENNNIYGTDPDEIATALEAKLGTMIS